MNELLPIGVTDNTWVYVEHSENIAYVAHVHRPSAVHTVCMARSLADLQRVRAAYVEVLDTGSTLVDWCLGCFPPASTFEVEPDEHVSPWRRFLNWLRA